MCFDKWNAIELISFSTDRDFYSLSLLEFNAILEYAGIDLLEDTRDLDFESLMNHIANLRSHELTPKLKIFLRYVDVCISRIFMNTAIIDYICLVQVTTSHLNYCKYYIAKSKQPSYFCYICKKAYYSRSILYSFVVLRIRIILVLCSKKYLKVLEDCESISNWLT